MGASQSKAETIYSRYPAESEIFKDIKLTPAVIERISQTQTPVPAPSEKTTPTPVVEVDIEKIKDELRYEVESSMRQTVESELRTQLEADYYEKLSQIAEMNQADAVETKTRIDEINADFERIHSEHLDLKSQLEEAQHGKQIALDKVDIAIQTAQEEAAHKIRSAEDAMAQKRLELSEMQQKETEQLLQRTKVIFDSRVTDKPICPDIEAQLTQCYSENQSKSLLCAELVRQYQTCLNEEKDRYFAARISPKSFPESEKINVSSQFKMTEQM